LAMIQKKAIDPGSEVAHREEIFTSI